MSRLFLLAASLATCEAFVAVPAVRPAVQHRSSTPTALLDQLDLPYAAQLLAEIIDAEGERMYGAVDAPAWVAPVGGIAVIATALLPV